MSRIPLLALVQSWRYQLQSWNPHKLLVEIFNVEEFHLQMFISFQQNPIIEQKGNQIIKNERRKGEADSQSRAFRHFQ